MANVTRPILHHYTQKKESVVSCIAGNMRNSNNLKVCNKTALDLTGLFISSKINKDILLDVLTRNVQDLRNTATVFKVVTKMCFWAVDIL